MNLDWMIKSGAYAAHALHCGPCAADEESNCGGVTAVDQATAVAVLTAAVHHLRDEISREIHGSWVRIVEAKGQPM